MRRCERTVRARCMRVSLSESANPGLGPPSTFLALRQTQKEAFAITRSLFFRWAEQARSYTAPQRRCESCPRSYRYRALLKSSPLSCILTLFTIQLTPPLCATPLRHTLHSFDSCMYRWHSTCWSSSELPCWCCSLCRPVSLLKFLKDTCPKLLQTLPATVSMEAHA